MKGETMTSKYDVAQNPKTGAWAVIGNCGRGYWMQVSGDYATKQAAQDAVKFYDRADRAARSCVAGVENRLNQLD